MSEPSTAGSEPSSAAVDGPAQTQEAAALVRDEEIWFSDGNVVLEAQGRVFRVYQGLLSRDSEVFRDLFTIPQPSSEETYDGCAVVHLMDHPEELRHLLRVIFDGKRYYHSHHQLDFFTVAALIRLSHKYQVDYVRDIYLLRMKSCFCTDLKTWDVVRSKLGSPVMKFSDTDAIAAVNIARLAGANSMLPSAMYLCCQLDTELLLQGSPRLDGTLECLSLQDLAACINARSSLVRVAISSSLDVLDPSKPSLQCDNMRCRRTVESMRRRILDGGSPARGLAPSDVLISEVPNIRNAQRLHFTGSDLCQNCADVLCSAEQCRRNQFWEGLPKHLSVGIAIPADWPHAQNPPSSSYVSSI